MSLSRKDLRTLVKELNTRTARVRNRPEKTSDHAQKKGKLSCRTRIEQLLDVGTKFLELGLFAAYELYEEQGGCPAAGVVIGIGQIHGRQTMIVAGDASIKAGAWFPMTAKKNLRAQEIALENRIPIVYLVDSAGVFLPMQDEIFPDKMHFGRQFYNNARLSAEGILQVAAVMGSCVAGGAYLPAMCDEALMVEGTGSLFLAGSYLVKAAIGEEIDNETLGGAQTHACCSGVIDQRYPDDPSALKAVRKIFARLPAPVRAGFNRTEPKAPTRPAEDIYDLLPPEPQKPYSMQDLLSCILDAESLDLYKPEYGQTLICGYARIDGWAVGIVANERKIVRNARGEMQMGGVIYSDSAAKAARFIMNCNQRHLPIVFFHDVSGFMVGSQAEKGGIIKDGAKMVNVVANSVVPKFTVLVGNSFGAGNYAMCGRAYDPRLCLAWPSALLAVMSGESAAQTLLQLKASALKKKGELLSEQARKELLEEIRAQYARSMSPYYAAARMWIDEIIDPLSTRSLLAQAIDIADHAPIKESFKTGILQT